MSRRLMMTTLLLALILWPLCTLALAGTTVLAEVTAKSLKVRSSPSTTSALLGGLKRGDKITASLLDSGWARFRHGRATGYIDSRYIKTLAVISAGENRPPAVAAEQKCRAATAKVNLKINTVDLTCSEKERGIGYAACAALFDLVLTSDCSENLRAFISCEAEFLYQKSDDFMQLRATEIVSEIVPISYGHASLQTEVFWRPNLIQGAVVAAQLKNASCAVYSVYDN